jgi:ABC-type sulfate/molybdate transport systems ATPase subunit
MLAGGTRPTDGVVTGRRPPPFEVGLEDLGENRSDRKSGGVLLARSRLARIAPGRAEQAIGLAGLEELQGRSPRTYSTSERWRFEVSRGALSSDILLVDDLFLPCERGATSQLRALLTAYVREWGGTLVFSTGDASDARNFADRVAILEEGRCRVIGPTDEVTPPPPPAAFSVRLFGPSAVAFTREHSAGQVGEALADVRVEGESAFLDLFRKVLS